MIGGTNEASVLFSRGKFAHMMYEGKHIHYSPVDNKPLCSYSAKLCKQRRLNNYAFCIRHILEDRSAPFKQCAHVAKYNNQKCTNPIPSNEDREYCNSHMQVAGMAPKKERKAKREKDLNMLPDGKIKFADRLKALLKTGDIINSDDQSSLDDPYAFPDPISETSQDKSPPVSIMGSPRLPEQVTKVFLEVASKLEQNKNSPHSENKVKSNITKSSKTMNRLQAKIAQNKILDKMKKNQESSLTVASVVKCKENVHSITENLSNHSQDLSAENLSNASFNTDIVNGADKVKNCKDNQSDSYSDLITNHHNTLSQSVNSPCASVSATPPSYHQATSGIVNIQPKKYLPNQKRRNCKNSVPRPLQRLQEIWENHSKYKADLYPLGIELSDSDSNESDTELCQRHWFFSRDKTDKRLHSGLHEDLRTIRLEVMKSEIRRRYIQLCKSQNVSKLQQKFQCGFVQNLLQAAKYYPSKTSECIQSWNNQETKPKTCTSSTGLIKRQCCYLNDKEKCNSTALPYTRHCIKHIMYNVDQILYEHCTAKFADNTQCCVPVFDICHELPLCPEHARKRDNYNRMSAEPKPKKPRKKTKPSALTRPPKRGKKKKRQNIIRPTKQPSTIPAPESSASTASSTDVPSSMTMSLETTQLSPGPAELNAEDITKDLGDPLDSELGNELDSHLSPGSIEKSLDLPLDAAELANQATRLLEEHDFTEVLNKIPDDAFNEFFTESKNGEFLPTKEETEELERALAAVDKDVKSLQKLSAENNDITELANSIDLQDTLLNADNLTNAIDENALSELTQGNINMDNLNVITNSLSSNDLNSISQVLSNISAETLVQNSLTANIVDGAILQGHLPGVHLLPELLQGQLQLQVPVGATQTTNFVLGPQLLGATFTTEHTSSQGSFTNGSALQSMPGGSFPQTLAQTLPLSTHDGISISLQSQIQGIRTGQLIINSADQTFTPMIYQNGFPINSQPFTQQVSTIGSVKIPFPASVEVLKQSTEESDLLNNIDQSQTFNSVNGNGTGSTLTVGTITNAFPIQNVDSPKETVS